MFEKAIAELLAKQEITEVLARIARGTDRQLWLVESHHTPKE